MMAGLLSEKEAVLLGQPQVAAQWWWIEDEMTAPPGPLLPRQREQQLRTLRAEAYLRLTKAERRRTSATYYVLHGRLRPEEAEGGGGGRHDGGGADVVVRDEDE